MFICGEDELSRAVLTRLVSDLCDIQEVTVLGPKSGGIEHIIKRLPAYFKLATRELVVVMVDLDGRECEPGARSQLFSKAGVAEPLPEFMIFGIAKREVEAWLLADLDNFSAFLGISKQKIDPNSESNTLEPKEYLLALANGSSVRAIRNNLLPTGNRKIGLGYNRMLITFAMEQWNHEAAAANSLSLARMRARISSIAV